MRNLARTALEHLDDHNQVKSALSKINGMLEYEVIFETPAFKGGHKWLKMIKSHDPNDPGKKDFYFVERKGKDSVAFLCYSDDRPGELLTLSQYASQHKSTVCGCATGSLDKPGLSIPQIVIEEVSEEMGYDVDENRLRHISTEVVGSSVNELKYLYLVDVTGLPDPDTRKPESIFEELSTRTWRTIDEVLRDCEWGAKLLAYAYLEMKKNA